MRSFMDVIKFNDKGHQVTMIKKSALPVAVAEERLPSRKSRPVVAR